MSNEDVIKLTHEPHILACVMTETEVQQEQAHLLRTMQDGDDLEMQRKAVASDFRARKEKLEEILMECRKKLRSGLVMRAIPCTLHMNFSKLTVTEVRDDTGEVVNERPMQQNERNLLNATAPLPGMEEVSGINQEMAGDGGPGPATASEGMETTSSTSPFDAEPMTEEEAEAEATEKFGPEDDDEFGMGE